MDEETEADDDDDKLPELQDLIPSSLPSPSPPKKRQRFSPALYKPFKTPLKASNKANAATSSSPVDSSATAKSTEIPKSGYNFPIRNTPHLPHKTRSTSSSPTKPSPHLDQLQKKHTALLNELSSLRASLETTNQALEIESSSTDAELEGLIRKWKSATSDVAEEVFGIMKEKVDGMGGYKAWRAKEKETECRGWNEAGDSQRNHGAENMEGEYPDDDEGFTMETMLKSLGIPLDKIGYDRESQRWMD